MIKVKATHKFMQEAQKALSPEALQDLIDELSLFPEKGVVVVGTGGIRKMRWRTGKGDRGKSGGVRVFYYYEKNVLIVLLISLFRKADKSNIDASEKKELRKRLPELLRRYTHE